MPETQIFNDGLIAQRDHVFLILEHVMSFEDLDELKVLLRQIVNDCVSKGPGYAQEGVVLRSAKSALRPQSLTDEQRILEAWHRLFIDGELGWGHNLDNPGAPFFHSAAHQTVATGGAR